MATLRLFFACPLPDTLLPALQAIQAHLRRSGARGRWTGPAGWHLTLLFLGATRSDRMPDLLAAGAEASEAGPPGPMRILRLTAFPSPRRPRVVVAELDDPGGRMARMRDLLKRRLEVLDARAFRPHVTLLRVLEPEPIRLPTPRLAPSFRPDRLILYQSLLGPGGARYEPLAAWPLSPRPDAPDG